MLCHVRTAAIRAQHGRLLGARGRALVEQAYAALAGESVQQPERIMAALGLDLVPASQPLAPA